MVHVLAAGAVLDAQNEVPAALWDWGIIQKQFACAKKLAGLPAPVVLYCARHRFSTDAMEGTGNVMAVMDVMGHSKVEVTRLYQHPGLKQIGMAINKRNEAVH